MFVNNRSQLLVSRKSKTVLCESKLQSVFNVVNVPVVVFVFMIRHWELIEVSIGHQIGKTGN